MIKLVVGLGNPGKEYENNRHNLGYKVIDDLAKRKRKSLKAGKGDYFFCRIESGDKELFLVKPSTFMNISGWVVVDCLTDFDMRAENLFVLCDDINLPLGEIRIREGGSDGGHKGLRSIIYQLNTLDFARLRMGVGMPEEETDLEQYVLDDFKQGELGIVDKMIRQSADAVEDTLVWGIKQTMNKYNQKT
jgi:PTH1 family peptidyl-tRNA hydrolase